MPVSGACTIGANADLVKVRWTEYEERHKSLKMKSSPEVIKHFPCSTQLSMKIFPAHKC